MPRVLHVLSQRPSLTGSGVTLDAVVRNAARSGWNQHVVIGIPGDEQLPEVGGLGHDAVSPLRFEVGPLDFPVPGMSDVMPYRSTRFGDMDDRRLASYREVWREHLSEVVDAFRPDLIHSHHLWIVSSLLKDVAPRVPVVAQCHATGLRQMRLCPGIAPDVQSGCARIDRFLALHRGDADEIEWVLRVSRERIQIVGAGYRKDLFHSRGREPSTPARLVYVGKYSAAKGLPWLLDAFERLEAERPGLELHVVGSGAGEQADELSERMRTMSGVKIHGLLTQARLGDLLRECRLFVLPSFYEGVPLVLVEALACGCRPVATDLPGVRELAPRLGPALTRITLPRLTGVDTPDPRDLPAFVEALTSAIDRALEQPIDPEAIDAALAEFTWPAVFERIESVWRELV